MGSNALVFVLAPAYESVSGYTTIRLDPEVKFAFGDPREHLSLSLLEGDRRRAASPQRA